MIYVVGQLVWVKKWMNLGQMTLVKTVMNLFEDVVSLDIVSYDYY